MWRGGNLFDIVISTFPHMLPENLSNKSGRSLKIKVTLKFLNYLTVIENKIINVFGRILLQLLKVLGFYLSSLHSEDL